MDFSDIVMLHNGLNKMYSLASNNPKMTISGESSGKDKTGLHQFWIFCHRSFDLLQLQRIWTIVSLVTLQKEQRELSTFPILKSLLFKNRMLFSILYWNTLK